MENIGNWITAGGLGIAVAAAATRRKRAVLWASAILWIAGYAGMVMMHDGRGATGEAMAWIGFGWLSCLLCGLLANAAKALLHLVVLPALRGVLSAQRRTLGCHVAPLWGASSRPQKRGTLGCLASSRPQKRGTLGCHVAPLWGASSRPQRGRT
jgi:hypothetical protein